uniref:Sulfotransfer_1 domain-containing protein n=1 Tax=Ascaris lumbricoides TaxID=6252 RepID=A0A0M3HKC4_ASCLU
MPLKEIIAETPKVTKEHLKMFMEEMKGSVSIEKKEMIENMGVLQHGEARKEYLFNSPQ